MSDSELVPQAIHDLKELSARVKMRTEERDEARQLVEELNDRTERLTEERDQARQLAETFREQIFALGLPGIPIPWETK